MVKLREWLDELQRLISSYTVLIAVLGAIALILIHVIAPKRFGVDATSVALIALILVVPYLRFVRRIRLGDFEAAIGSEEVAAVGEQARSAAQHAESRSAFKLAVAYSELAQMSETDPIVAFATIRARIEAAVRRLVRLYSPDSPERSTFISMVRRLEELDLIPADLRHGLIRFRGVTNRAIHGASIAPEDAENLTATGISLLSSLESLLLQEPRTLEVISEEEQKAYSSGLYHVTTITPIVGNPKKETYILTQPQLDSMLEGYDEYAQYLVEMHPLTEEEYQVYRPHAAQRRTDSKPRQKSG